MSLISIFRLVTMCISLLFGIVVLALTARWTQASEEIQGVLWNFEVVALLSGSLTLVMIPTFLILAAIRRGAWTSMIMVELPSLSALWILYLITGALTAELGSVFYPFGCTITLGDGVAYCRQFFAIEGLSFVIWILLLLYTVTLLTFTIIAQTRGRNLWKVSVNDAIFFDGNPRQDYPGITYTAASSAPVSTLPQHFQYPPANASVSMLNAQTPIPAGSHTHNTQPGLSHTPLSNPNGYPQV